MGVIGRIVSCFQHIRDRAKHLRLWTAGKNGSLVVTFDDAAVHLQDSARRAEPQSQQFRWDSIVRICFAAEDYLVSDGIYVFTTQRPESYAIPMDSVGGVELWNEILRRELFDAELSLLASSSITPQLFCWPPMTAREEPVNPGA